MHISRVRIRNFRNFLKADFAFREGVNTLVGENGSGKTNALFAFRLLLDETLSRNSVHLRHTDFCRRLGRWQGHWIVISIDFEDLDPSEGCQLVKHAAGHMDGSESGTYTFYFRPKPEVRRTLFQMSEASASVGDFASVLGALTTDEYEPVFAGRAQGDLLDEGTYSAAVGDFDARRFPDPDQDDQALLGVRMSSPLHAEIACTFVQAVRDAVADLRGFRGNPLLALLRGTESEITLEDASRITEAVASLNRDIASLPEIKAIATGIQSKLDATVGHTFSPTVGIESMLPDQLDRLLQRLAVIVGDDADHDYRGDLSEVSLGNSSLALGFDDS